MHIISNQQMEYIIRFIELMLTNTDPKAKSLRTQNNIRLAKILLERLRAKQPFSANELPADVRKKLGIK